MSDGETSAGPDVDELRWAALVGDPRRFAATHWGIRPLHRAAGQDFGDLLGVDDVEGLLATGARLPTFRLVRDGVTLPPSASTRPARLGGRRLDDVADLARIADAVGAGASVVLQSLQRTHPPLIELCRSIERATSHPVQANAYVSPRAATGLARHRDDHHVLVLQASGSKMWEVEGLGELVMRTGDVLYLPAGTGHAASTAEGPSLHITLGLLAVTRADVVRRLLEASPDPALRSPLPIGYARPERTPELTADLAAMLDALAGSLASVDPGDLAGQEQERARRRRRPLPTGRLRAALGLDDVDAATVVVRRPDQFAELAADRAADGRIRLLLADRTIDLPDFVEPAVRRLLAGESAVVADLPGLEPSSAVVLARRLHREGLLELLQPS